MNIVYEQFKVIVVALFFLVFLPLSILYLWRAERRRRTTKKESLKRVCIIAFILAIIFGVALYSQSFSLPQHPEPWDIHNGFFYIFLELCAGFILGLLFPECLTTSYFGSWLGQIIGLICLILMSPSSDRVAWLPLGIITTGIYNCLILGGAVTGKSIRKE
ncbi:MAG: hypothetical protein WC081_01670 [Candidatus Ratteibacteria bacterium]|jgi:peptidoglycan/LPS O-acetylase OafA/YrhL